ncbi:MAG: RDD family protein [Lachnospiraceae bacterium]|nr:RDD family protein [Lachnospiraceae bacterium]
MDKYSHMMYAGFWLRFFAYLVDILLISALTGGLLGSLFRMLSISRGSGILTLYGALGLLLFLAYFVLLTKLSNGQTIGKMIFGLRVVGKDKEKLSWGIVLLREGVGRYILQAIPFGALYVVAGFTPKKQGIADLLIDTYVVKEEIYKLMQEVKRVEIPCVEIHKDRVVMDSDWM